VKPVLTVIGILLCFQAIAEGSCPDTPFLCHNKENKECGSIMVGSCWNWDYMMCEMCSPDHANECDAKFTECCQNGCETGAPAVQPPAAPEQGRAQEPTKPNEQPMGGQPIGGRESLDIHWLFNFIRGKIEDAIHKVEAILRF